MPSYNGPGETVLIAAFSGRALAQSASRAGYVPLVADAFGDIDTRAASADCRVIDGAMRSGFRAKSLIAALDDLCTNAVSKPIGLVLGSGFEDKPKLIGSLAKRYRLLGNDAGTIETCNNPRVLFPMLRKLGIAYPEIDLESPDKPEGWLSKRIGGSGGRHIRHCTKASRATLRRYFQRHTPGERVSVSALAVGKDLALYFTRQWCAADGKLPFRYGGAISTPEVDVDAPSASAMFKAVAQLIQVFDLKGALSFDFIVDGDIANLVDINPRPGASIDVVDNSYGGHFAGHVAAFSESPKFDLAGPPIVSARAAAVLHADRGALTLGDTPWPEWSADRGAPGTFVPNTAPLATAFAEAATADEAEALARTRLAELEDLIYAHARPS